MNNITILFVAIAALLLLPLGAQSADKAERQAVERFALYIAANDGGEGRERLRYALSDARRLAATLGEVGGVESRNSMILADPDRKRIHDAFAHFANVVDQRQGKARRTEFILYYSGHSDENALLLGNETFSYSELKESLSLVPSDVHVVMLDSCFSGSFVRAKGGSRKQPFLMDDASEVKGHAYLSSSSAEESSQESDIIQASYFTHSLITGLRGAADASGDRKVSLNELYHYAFNDTLSKTEASSFGPQHPSFNITMVGSGDLVLTDITNADSALIFPDEAEGRYFIRTFDGHLVSELNKVSGTGIALAVPKGRYVITLVTPLATSQANITLEQNEHFVLGATQFLGVPRAQGRPRGDVEPVEVFEKVTEWTPFVIGLVPSLTIPRKDTENANISLGFFAAKNRNIRGVQASIFGAHTENYLQGVQASMLFNMNGGGFSGAQLNNFVNITYGGEAKGAQLSGFLNFAGNRFHGMQGAGFLNVSTGPFNGFQAAGFINVATGPLDGVQAAGFINIATEVHGLQAGIVNVARNNTGVSLGLFNIILEGVLDPAVYLDSNGNCWFQYQGGTNLFYTTYQMGYDMNWTPTKEADTLFFGFGVGTRRYLSKRFSLDLEVLSRVVLDVSDNNEYLTRIRNGEEIVTDTDEEREAFYDAFVYGYIPSVRLSLNVHLMRHLAVFGALNVDVRIAGQNDDAFEAGNHAQPYEITDDSVWLYPSLAFGIKF